MKALTVSSLLFAPLLLVGLSPQAHAGWLLGPDSYYECLLDELDDVEDDSAAVMAANACLQAFPDMLLPEKKSSLLFGPGDSAECVEKKGRGHPSSAASIYIQEACYVVYPNPTEEESSE